MLQLSTEFSSTPHSLRLFRAQRPPGDAGWAAIVPGKGTPPNHG